MRFRIVPVPRPIAEQARSTSRAPGYGHPVHRDVAAGYGPCRSCLQPFGEGADRRLLFTYDPFRDLEPLPLPGPIYVHDQSCPAYEAQNEFPESLRFIPMTFNAYGSGRQLREVRYVEPHGDAEAVIGDLLGRADVEYIHARNTEAGCYIFRIERTRSST